MLVIPHGTNNLKMHLFHRERHKTCNSGTCLVT